MPQEITKEELLAKAKAGKLVEKWMLSTGVSTSPHG